MSSTDRDKTASRDANRDPISGTPGSHPGGVAAGGIAGAVAVGAAAGTVLGPIGMLLGGAAGAIAGGAIGKGIAESIDPTEEAAFWRENYRQRPYVRSDYDYDRDYAVAYGFGLQAREAEPRRGWEESENALKQRWDEVRGESRLDWDDARGAVQDAWRRADRTHRTHAATDDYFAARFEQAPYREDSSRYEHFAPAYRYGARARSLHSGRPWGPQLEADLERDWQRHRGASSLDWEAARPAVEEAFVSYEDYVPEGFDKPDKERFEVR